MSFWENLEITRKSFLEEDVIKKLPDGYFIKTGLLCSYDKVLVQRLIIDFHDMGNIKVMLNDYNYDIYVKLGTCCGIIYNSNCEAIGLILTVMLPISKDKEIGINNGYTSYYCIKNEYRGMGYGKILLQSIIKFGYKEEINIRRGYHIYSVEPYPSLKIKQWLIDLKRKEQNNKMYNKEECKNYIKSFEHWKSEEGNYKMVYSPKESDWIKWVEGFETYELKDKYVFSIEYENIIYKGCEIKIALMLIGSGQDIEMLLEDAIQISKRGGARILYVYEIGKFDSISLEFAGFKEGTVNINMALYNYECSYSKTDIMVPFV